MMGVMFIAHVYWSSYKRVEFVRDATSLMSGAGDPLASISLVRKRADNICYSSTLTRLMILIITSVHLTICLVFTFCGRKI